MEHHTDIGNKQTTLIDEIVTIPHKLAQYRNPIQVSFFLVILFFFFGFCNFKCNGTKVASLTGINLVTGTHLKTQMNGLFDANSFNPGASRKRSSRREKIPANFWAILAFLAAIAGFVIFYRKSKREALGGTILGITGIVALFILRLVVKNKLEEHGGGMVHIEASFLFGYWASLLAFIVAGGLSYLRLKQENTRAKPSFETGKTHTPIHINVITQHQHEDKS